MRGGAAMTAAGPKFYLEIKTSFRHGAAHSSYGQGTRAGVQGVLLYTGYTHVTCSFALLLL